MKIFESVVNFALFVLCLLFVALTRFITICFVEFLKKIKEFNKDAHLEDNSVDMRFLRDEDWESKLSPDYVNDPIYHSFGCNLYHHPRRPDPYDR
jgi:hypothetical protein